jgi:hypothetical protein
MMASYAEGERLAIVIHHPRDGPIQPDLVRPNNDLTIHRSDWRIVTLIETIDHFNGDLRAELIFQVERGVYYRFAVFATATDFDDHVNLIVARSVFFATKQSPGSLEIATPPSAARNDKGVTTPAP